MPSTRVVIIGAGQAGLAVSHLLTAASIDHVVLERGRTAERWRSQRWDSLRLLTPNWMSRLPGWSYRGDGPRRVHAGRRGGRVPDRLRRVVPVPRCVHGHGGAGSVRRQAVARYLVGTADARVSGDRRRGRHRHRVLRRAGGSRGGRLAGPVDPSDDPGPVPQSGRAAGRRCAGRRGLRDRRAARRRTGGRRPAGACWPSAGTPGCPAGTGGGTSCGGWTAWACSTGRWTAQRIRRHPEPSLQIVGSSPDGVAREVDLPSLADARHPADRPAHRRRRPRVELRRRSAATAAAADAKLGRLLGRIDRSRRGDRAGTTKSIRRTDHARSPTSDRRDRPARPAGSGHPLGDLGDRLPAALPVAARSRARRRRRDPAHRRSHRRRPGCW